MDHGAGVSEKTLARLAGFPGVGRHIEGHVDHHRRANDVVARNAAPEAAIVGIGAIVTHREITIVRNVIGKLDVGLAWRRASGRRRLGWSDRITLGKFLPVYIDRSA